MYMHNVIIMKFVVRIKIFILYSWTTLGWPRKIQDQSDNCIKQLDQDEERFQKNLTNDQSTFEDRLDSLEVKCLKLCILCFTG